MKSSDKEVATLLAECKALGWSVEKGTRHWRVLVTDGKTIIVIPNTPSDRRSLLNCQALVKRAKRSLACPTDRVSGSPSRRS